MRIKRADANALPSNSIIFHSASELTRTRASQNTHASQIARKKLLKTNA